MSAVESTNRDPLAGLTLDAILTAERSATSAMAPSPAPPAQVSRTLLDIIRDEEPHGSFFGHKDKKSWKAFRDRLRLKRAGAAWTSSVPIPASDIPIHNTSSVNPNTARFSNSRSLMSRRNSLRYTTLSSVSTPSEQHSNPETSASAPTSRPVMTRRISTRYSPDSPQSEEADIHAVSEMPPAASFTPQMSRHNSTRYPPTSLEAAEEGEEEPAAHEGTRRLATVLAEERALSAREAVAAQEAAEAEAAAQAEQEEEAEAEAAAQAEQEEEAEEEGTGEAQPVRMSLMDLLEETDRQMGLVGSRYTVGEVEEKEEEEEEEEEGEEEGGGRVEHTCCVCMVRHKGAAFIPCGHTFCRFCSRELWVQRGNCPLCNGFILEILDIF